MESPLSLQGERKGREMKAQKKSFFGEGFGKLEKKTSDL